MFKTVLRIVGITLFVGYLLVAGILYACWRPEPKYQGIKIQVDYPNDEAHFVTEKGILDLVSSKPGFKYKGKHYSEVNTLELAQYIEEKNQLVLHASCVHTPDSILRIDIEQRCPLMRVKSQSGVKCSNGRILTDFFIDRNGDIMPAQFGNAVHLPLATGYIKSDDIKPLYDFAFFLKDNDFWNDEITQIYVRQDGDYELVPRIGDHTILVGNFDNIDTKLDHVRKFYSKVLPRTGWNAYRTIDVKFDGQVIGEK